MASSMILILFITINWLEEGSFRYVSDTTAQYAEDYGALKEVK